MHRSRNIIILLSAIVIIALVFGAYFYLFFKTPAGSGSSTASNNQPSGFTPFGRTPTQGGQEGTTTGNPITSNTQTSQGTPAVIPTLRLLSNSPIGGYGATTTATTTIVHWIDRGRGNVFEVRENSAMISTLSNTLLPRMYQSLWNRDATAFVGFLLQDGNTVPTTVYATLLPQTTPKISTSTDAPAQSGTVTPFTLKGNSLPDNVIATAESPKKDKVFVLIDNGDSSTGYVAAFGAKTMTQIFTSPLTQVNVEWPSDNIIAITTKGTAAEGGFLYFADPKTGAWTKILGPLAGLSTKVSHDAKYVLASATNGNSITTTIYNVQKGTSIDAVIRTLADKCTWGNFYKNLVYCGVSSQLASATYPDDWYKGIVTFSDKIWQVNADTGEVHLISSITDQSDRIIDSFNLGLDTKDNYLFFMNKNDLSFWSLDLVKQ